MAKSFLKFALITVIIILLSNVVIISKDYQDSWILEGLEISFALFMATYSLTFFSEKKVSWMVFLAVIGRFMFLLIANLKYYWFQGTAIDQHMQYSLANHVSAKGYISTQGPFSVKVYGNTPLIHLSFAIFSIVLNITVVDSIKYLPVFLSPLVPLLTYVIIKKSEFSRDKTVLKYALFISSLPITSDKFVVTGSQFGYLLAFLILGSLVMFFQKNDRRHLSVFMFLVFTLAATHSASSVLLTAFLLAITLFQRIPYFRLKSYLSVPHLFIVTLISAAWLNFPAIFTLETLSRFALVLAPTGSTYKTEEVPVRFFELINIDILAAIKTVLVFYGAEVFLLLLTLISLTILLKRLRKLDNTSKFLFLVCGVVLLYMPFAFLIKLGPFRILHFVSFLFPIFPTIFIFHTGKKKTWLAAAIFLLIMFLVPLQLYNCQPLIPPANILQENLPSSEPIVYVNSVNSIYQRQMVEFTGNYVSGRIACDRVTQNQIIGLTEINFSLTHLAWDYYPLYQNQLERRYDCFLIHLPGVSGPFREHAEFRTRGLILEAIYNSSVIYTNGESYILDYSP